MKLSQREIIQFTIGIVLAMIGLGISSVFILSEWDLFTGIALGIVFVAFSTYAFVNFGLKRYIAGKNLTTQEIERGNKIAQMLSIGIAVSVFFLIPFGKMMLEDKAITWAVITSLIIVILGASICVITGINWNQEVIKKQQK